MWYLGSLLSVILMLLACAATGEILVGCLPGRMRPATRLFLAPLLGLAVLLLAATLAGWLGHGYRHWLCLGVTAALAAGGVWLRWGRSVSVRHLATLGGFGVLASFPALASVLRRGAFSTHNDAIIYLTHAQWLQSHGFRDAVDERMFHPALTQVWLFQNHGLRMGASFWLGWVQSLLDLTWSVEAYPATVALSLVCGAMSVGAVVLTVCPHRRLEAWLAALVAAVTLNGFAYSSIAGFLPQLCGLSFIGGALVLRGLEIIYDREAEPALGRRWLGALPQAVCLAAAILSYSEMIPFLLSGMGLSYLLPWPRPGGWRAIQQTVVHRAKQAGTVAALTLLLTNGEWLRIPKAIALQMHVLAGGPNPWRWWEYPAHALGLRSGFGEGRAWYFLLAVSVLLPGLAVVALWLCSLRSRRWHGVSPGGRVRRAGLWPVVGLALLYAVAFLIFRYVYRSPWPDLPGVRHFVGQTYYQTRLSHWSSLPLLGCVLSLLIVLGQRGGYRGRGAVVVLFTLWCACGLGANFRLAFTRPETNLWAAGRSCDPFNSYTDAAASFAAVPRTDLIYLNMPEPEAYLTRQLLAYYLQDRRVASVWTSDLYIGPWLGADKPMPFPGQCDWVVSYARVVGSPVPPAYLTVRPSSHHPLVLSSVDSPYGPETVGKDSWYWTGNRLRFRFHADDPRPHHVHLRFFYHSTTEHRSLVCRLINEAEERTIEIPMLPGDQPTILPLEWKGGVLDVDFSTPQPPLAGPPGDPREFAYQIKNISVDPLD